MKKQKYLVIIVPILLLIGGVYYFSRGQVSVFNVHSLLIQKDIKTYTISSAGIATGRFIEKGSVDYSPDRTMLYTNYTFELDEAIKGLDESQKTINIQRYGGEDNGTVMNFPDEAEFELNKPYLVFLGTNEAGKYVVFARSNGIFALEGGEVIDSSSKERFNQEAFIEKIRSYLR